MKCPRCGEESVTGSNNNKFFCGAPGCRWTMVVEDYVDALQLQLEAMTEATVKAEQALVDCDKLRVKALDWGLALEDKVKSLQAELETVERLSSNSQFNLDEWRERCHEMEPELDAAEAKVKSLQAELDGHVGCCVAHGRYKIEEILWDQ